MRLVFVLLTASAYGQMTLVTPDIQLNATGQAAFVKWFVQQSTKISAPLTTGVNSGAISLTLTIANWQPAINTRIGVEDEAMLVTAKSANVLTVTRGVGGTVAVAHLAGVEVRELLHQSPQAASKFLLVSFIRSRLEEDAGLRAPVTAAEAARTATIEAAVQ